MSFKLMLMLQAVSSQAGPGPADLHGVDPPALPGALSAISRCDKDGEPDAVIVCGGRADRFRLPLPSGRGRADLMTRGPGDAPSGLAALTPVGRCGLFEGERRCGKAEAARYGYGGGRNPITLLTKLGTKLLDPDAEVSEPSDRP